MIGVALVEYLLSQDCEVTGLVRPHSEHISRLPKHANLRIVEHELASIYQLSVLLEHDYDIMYHLAWANTGVGRDKDVLGQIENIKLSLDALELCSRIGCSTFVGAGSQAEYGPKTDGPIGRNSTEEPVTTYGICKSAAGKLVSYRGAELGIRCFWPRIFSIFGQYDRSSSLISHTVQCLKDNKTLQLTKGTQIWDYLYAADAAIALWLIGEKGIVGKKYCIGSGIGRPLHEYIDFIRSQIKSTSEIRFGDIPFDENSVMYLVADIEELMEDTGFSPDYTFERGIRDMLEKKH